jgi:carbonic anhydrase/acetyltransferase-like protein (isoleucine patch superfamily)
MIKSLGRRVPRIAPTAYISESACVIGDVEIGDGAGVWPGAVIRADFGRIVIGAGTHVEDNCVLHTGRELLIGHHVMIGHGAVVHCRSVGNHVLIGMNATILEQAEIGSFCIVAAASLVKTGMKIPERSLVRGAPARVVGEVGPEWIERLASGAEQYARMAGEAKREGI